MPTRTAAAAASGTGGGSTGSSSTVGGGGGGRGFTVMMASLNPFGKRSGSGSTFTGRQGRGAGGGGGGSNAEAVPRSYNLNGAGGTVRASSERLGVADQQAPIAARRCVLFHNTNQSKVSYIQLQHTPAVSTGTGPPYRLLLHCYCCTYDTTPAV